MRSAMPVAADPAPRNMIRRSVNCRSGDPRGRVDAGQRHGGRALDVVVEAEHAIAVLVQQRVGVGRQEVLELDQRARVALLHGPHELVDEVEVRLPVRRACAGSRGRGRRPSSASLFVPTSSITGRQCFGGMPAHAV